MQTNTHEWRTLVNEAAYSLIREQASNELPLYVSMRDRYFADPAGFTAAADTVDRPLGIGTVEIVHTFSQAVFPLLASMLPALTTAVAAALQKEVTDQLIDEVRKLFTKPEPIFSQAQLEAISNEISAIVKEQQNQRSLSPAQADAVRNAVIARLALAKKDRRSAYVE